MFDYIKRSQSHFVQQIDPDGLQMKPDFTFGMESSLASQSIVSKMGNAIAYKKGIGIVQKTHRKLNYLFSEPGLITDGGFRGFTLKKVDIPHNRDFQNEYNGKLEKLKKESGVVNILEDKVVVLNKIQSNQLESMFDIVYNAPTVGENVGFRDLYATLTNSKLDRVKDRLISYMQTFGRKGEIEMRYCK